MSACRMLALGTLSLTTIPQLGCANRSLHDDPAECVLERVAQSSGHQAQVCAPAEDGSLWCWGDNSHGQLGLGDASDSAESTLPPAPVEARRDWADASVGARHTCAIRGDGELWCWGANDTGQLGIDVIDSDLHPTPTRVGDQTGWTAVAAGEAHTCALRDDSTLWCWGANDQGQLGAGEEGESNPTPSRVSGETLWSHVSLGFHHGCGVAIDGALWCWGDNDNGQLGLGFMWQTHHAPVRVGTENHWRDVQTGLSHSCALSEQGTLWCWGSNDAGELGVGDDDAGNPLNYEPRQVGMENEWSRVSVATSRTCGLRNDGELWCWGVDLVDPSTRVATPTPMPTSVGAERWLDVSLGIFKSCAIDTDHVAWCWGGLRPDSEGVLTAIECP